MVSRESLIILFFWNVSMLLWGNKFNRFNSLEGINCYLIIVYMIWDIED